MQIHDREEVKDGQGNIHHQFLTNGHFIGYLIRGDKMIKGDSLKGFFELSD